MITISSPVNPQPSTPSCAGHDPRPCWRLKIAFTKKLKKTFLGVLEDKKQAAREKLASIRQEEVESSRPPPSHGGLTKSGAESCEYLYHEGFPFSSFALSYWLCFLLFGSLLLVSLTFSLLSHLSCLLLSSSVAMTFVSYSGALTYQELNASTDESSFTSKALPLYPSSHA
jgi:hypothetical protein